MKEFTAEIAEGAEEGRPADFLDDRIHFLCILCGGFFDFVLFALIRG